MEPDDGPDPGPTISELACSFEEQRPRLVRLAYTTLGSYVEAEDCVQGAWLRLHRVADPGGIRDVPAWLRTTVARLAMDVARSAHARRVDYVGTWLPEPWLDDAGTVDPADRVTLDDSVSMALMIVLERLSPAERTAFVLHDVFGVPFEEVAEVVGRTTVAVRKLATRARAHIEDEAPRFPPTYSQQREVVAAFGQASRVGDLQQLLVLLDPDVVCRSDGGGKVPAWHRLERGAEQVASVLVRFSRTPGQGMAVVDVNGSPGIVLRDAQGVLTVIAVTVDADRIVALDVVRNPDKLAHLPEHLQEVGR